VKEANHERHISTGGDEYCYSGSISTGASTSFPNAGGCNTPDVSKSQTNTTENPSLIARDLRQAGGAHIPGPPLARGSVMPWRLLGPEDSHIGPMHMSARAIPTANLTEATSAQSPQSIPTPDRPTGMQMEGSLRYSPGTEDDEQVAIYNSSGPFPDLEYEHSRGLLLPGTSPAILGLPSFVSGEDMFDESLFPSLRDDGSFEAEGPKMLSHAEFSMSSYGDPQLGFDFEE